MSREISKSSDTTAISEILVIAAKKGLAKITDIPTRLARLNSLFADSELKITIKEFSEYIDLDGVNGSDPRGLMLQINTRIKGLFGFPVNHEMSEHQSESIAAARRQAMRVCQDGVNKHQSSREIKDRIYKSIEQSAQFYHAQTRGF